MPSPTDASRPERLADADGERDGIRVFDHAIAYLSPNKHTSDQASISLRAGRVRACLSTILARLAAAESARDAAVARVDRLEEVLRECVNQIEYEHGKFGGTGSGETVLYRTRALLAGEPKP